MPPLMETPKYIWMNYKDLTSWRHWNDGNWIQEIIPNGLIPAGFRSVNYYNSAVCIYIYIYMYCMLSVYVHIYIYTYVCIVCCMYVYIYVYLYIYMHIYIHTHVYKFICCTYTYVIQVNKYMCIHIYIYVYIHIYIYIYIYILYRSSMWFQTCRCTLFLCTCTLVRNFAAIVIIHERTSTIWQASVGFTLFGWCFFVEFLVFPAVQETCD